jgi:DNA-binding GntR family transcriptional regulator
VTVPLDAVPGALAPGLPGDRGPRSAAKAVSEYLHELILNGVLRPGDRINQDEIADAIGVSRQPVGVALIRMEADGLVEIRPRRGVYVAALREDSVHDSYELIGVLLGYAAGRLAPRDDHATLERLSDLTAAMRAADQPEDLERLARTFYETIVRAAGSTRLRSLLRSLDRLLPGSFYERFPEVVEVGRAGAERVVDAIRRGDAEGAERTVRELWRGGGDLVVSDLRARGIVPAATADSPD